MIRFSTVGLMDDQKCYDYLVEIPHPDGLGCPECKTPVERSKVHRRDRAPVLYFLISKILQPDKASEQGVVRWLRRRRAVGQAGCRGGSAG